MPATTTAARISLRSARDSDREFLVALYGSTRTDLAQLPLDESDREALVRMQFHAQDVHYRQTNPGASFDVVEIDGRPVGRMYVDRSAHAIEIIDVSLLPHHRGAGLGTALISAVQNEAAATGRTVHLYVPMGNRAARLYERLDFRWVADLGVYRQLQWRAW